MFRSSIWICITSSSPTYLHVKTVGDDGPDGDEIDEDDLDDGLPVVPRAGGGQPSNCLQPVQSDGSQAQGGNVHRGALSANKIILGTFRNFCRIMKFASKFFENG